MANVWKILEKKITVKLINNSKDYARYVSKPNFISNFSRDFVAIYQKKSVLILDKPIDVGFIISELTKLLMHKFHYEYFKNKLLNCCLLILIV